MSEQELKPCPFCGSDELRLCGHSFSGYIDCLNCGAGTGLQRSADHAQRAWNEMAKRTNTKQPIGGV